eukprot:gene12883-12671_t
MAQAGNVRQAAERLLNGLGMGNRKGSLLLLLLSVITSTCLLLGIDLARQSAKASFSNAVAGTDLIVGAQTSPVSLLLYSVFRIGQATRNVPYAEFERLEQDPRVKSALPIALGDSYQGFAVVGTKAVYFDRFLYGARQNLQFAQGRAFEDYTVGKPAAVLFEAVLGAEVAKRLNHKVGDKIALSHGMQIQQTGPSHADKPFTVVGVLQATGTPVDQSVHISLAGMEAIHVDWAAGVPVPGVALSTLWQTVGVVERVLLFVAALVAVVSALGLTSVMLVTLGQRRRELAVLRSTGAGPRTVFGLLFLESALVMWVGVALGVLALALCGAALAPWVQAQFGLQLVSVGELGAGLLAVVAFAAFGSLLGL